MGAPSIYLVIMQLLVHLYEISRHIKLHTLLPSRIRRVRR